MKPAANPSNEEIAEVAANNLVALTNDAEILQTETDLAGAVAAVKTQKADELRKSASQIISGKDTLNATYRKSPEYIEAKKRMNEADLLDRDAATAARLADNLKESTAESLESQQMAEEYAQGIQNNTTAPVEDNLKRFNQLSNFTESKLNRKVRLNDIKEDTRDRYNQKTASASDMRQQADAINDKITSLENGLVAKEAALSDARGQAKKTLEEQIRKDRATIDSEKIRLQASLDKATQVEAEAVFLEREVDVIDEILAAGEDEEFLAEHLPTDNPEQAKQEPKSASNTTSATWGNVAPTNTEVIAATPKTEPAETSKTAQAPLETISSTTIVSDNKGANAESNAIPTKGIVLPVPEGGLEIEAAAIDLDLAWEESSLDEKEKALLPAKPLPADLIMKFDPAQAGVSLSKPDQSVRAVMYEGYHREYMNKFGEIAEEPDPLKRTAQTFVVNENWLADITREKKYLETLKGNEAIDQNILNQRLESLDKLADLKRTATLRSRMQLAEVATDATKSPQVIQEIKDYRANIHKAPASVEEPLAQNAASVPDANTPLIQNPESASAINPQNNASQSNISQGEKAVGETTNNAVPNIQPVPVQKPDSVAGVENRKNAESVRNFETTAAADVPLNTKFPNSEAQKSSQADVSSAQLPVSIAPLNKQMAQENLKEGFISELRPLPNAGAEQASKDIMEQKEAEIEEKKKSNSAMIAQMEQEEQAAVAAQSQAKRKERDEAMKRTHETKKALVIAQEEQKQQEYRLEQLRKAADLAAFGADESEMPSVLEASKSEKLKTEAQELRNTASVAAAAKAPRNKKKRMAHMDDVYEKDLAAARAEQKATFSVKLAEELKATEAETQNAKNREPLKLRDSEVILSNNQVQKLSAQPEYRTYDSLRVASDRYFKEAKMMEVRMKELESETNQLSESMERTESIQSKTEDPAVKSSLQTEYATMSARREQNTERLKLMKNNTTSMMASANVLRNSAIQTLENAPQENRDSLFALALRDETAGRFAYSAIDEADKKRLEERMSKDAFSSVLRGETAIPSALQEAVFEMIAFNKSVYNSDNPIPVDTKLPEGLVFKVQIGAFRNPPPQDIFKGFAPVRGENTRPGWIRYTAGLFNKKDQALLKRNELRTLGYTDAFVVAYLNGKRISMAEAEAMAAGGATAIPLPTTASSAGTISQVSEGVTQVEKVKGVFYTVQVGAFSKPVSNSQVYNLSPLIEYQSNGLYKYGSGIYSNANAAAEARRDLVSRVGVRDAFVTAFVDGRRISIDEANTLVSGGAQTAGNIPAEVAAKPQGGNIRFSIQLGAYRGEVPVEDAKSILVFTGLGIDIREEGGLTYYSAGSYKTYEEALQMAERIKSEGLPGAFIVAFSGTSKIDLQQAINQTK
jgi:hypothetical protein